MSDAIASHIDNVAQSADLPLIPQEIPGTLEKDLVKHQKWRLKQVLELVALVVIGTGIVAGILGYRRAHKAPGVTYETVQVDRGRIVARVTASGTLSALVTVQVGSQVSGRIQELEVDFNSPVKKGQVIARIDPKLLQSSVEQARANGVAAKGNLTKARALAADAKRQYLRNKTLWGKQFIAQADYDTAESNWQAAAAEVVASEGAVEQSQAALNQAQINLDYTTIISPTDGVVISRNVDVGQTVAATLQAPTLFVIAEDLRKMQVDTTVAEADVGKPHDGMAATFTVDAYGSEVFGGVVRQVRNAPQTVQNVVTYDAVIDVRNADLRLRPGMTANVTFVYGEKSSALRVPNAALRFRAPSYFLAGALPEHRPEAIDHRTVWALRAKAAVPVAIRTGISDGTYTELIEGELHEHDVLITDAGGLNIVPTRKVL